MILSVTSVLRIFVQGVAGKNIGSSIYQFFSSADLPLFKGLFDQGLKEKHHAGLSLKPETKVRAGPAFRKRTRTDGYARCGMPWSLPTLTEQKHNEAMRVEEEALQKAHDKLEAQVAERTVELRTALSEIQAMKEQLEVENIYFRHESKMKTSI